MATDMKTYLCDRLWNRYANPKSAWHKALSALPNFDVASACGDNHPPDTHIAYSDAEAIVFVHTEFPHEWKEKANAIGVLCHIVLVRGDGGEAAQSNERRNLHGCYWSPSQIETRALSEIVELTSRIKSGLPDWHTFLQPTSIPEFVLSWALLEAYGKGVDNAEVLQKMIQSRALQQLRERSAKTDIELTFSTARDELARYREDI